MKQSSKYILLTLLTILLFLTPSYANYNVEEYGDGVIITEYTGTDTDILVPATINGKKVKMIGEFAFAWTDVVRIEVPGSITDIASSAFGYCYSLEEVIINEGVTGVGDALFLRAASLTNVYLPASLEPIDSENIDLFSEVTATFTITAPQYVEVNGEPQPSAAATYAKKQEELRPSNVTYVPTNYAVDVPSFIGATVKLSNTVAEQGDSITVTVQTYDEYDLEEIYYTTEDGTKTVITDNEFIMPEEDIEIGLTLKVKLYELTVNTTPNGTITADKTEYAKGETVTLTITPDTGYEVTQRYYTDSSNHNFSGTTFKMPGNPVEVTVVFDKINYKITKPNSITGGTITINTTAQAGDTVTVTVTPNRGYRYVEGTLSYNDGTDHQITGNQFTMPASPITITAEFEKIPYILTITGGANGTVTPNGTITTYYDETTKITITPNTNYVIDQLLLDGEEITKTHEYTFKNVTQDHELEVTFKEVRYKTFTLNMSNIIEITIEKQEDSEIMVQKSGNGKFLGWLIIGLPTQNENSFTFNMPNNAVEVTYQFEEPNYNTVEIETTGTVNQTELSNAIAATNSDTVQITVPTNATEIEVTIPTANVTEIADHEDIQTLKIQTEVATVTIPKEAIETIETEATGSNITVRIKECASGDLTAEQQAVVGSNKAYQFEIISNGSRISEFNSNVMVTIPYTPQGNENTNTIKVYYIAADGTATETNTVYANGYITFTTMHFSEYYIQPGEEIIEEPEKEPEEEIKPDTDKETTTVKKKRKKKVKEEVKKEPIELTIMVPNIPRGLEHDKGKYITQDLLEKAEIFVQRWYRYFIVE